MEVCQDLLNQYKLFGDSFLDLIITNGKTNITAMTQSQNISPCSGDLRISQSSKQPLVGDAHCLLGSERGDPSGFPGINKPWTLTTTSPQWLNWGLKLIESGQSQVKTTFLLQYDNIKLHTASLSWTVLQYSPDLVPSNHQMFGLMNDGLWGQCS